MFRPLRTMSRVLAVVASVASIAGGAAGATTASAAAAVDSGGAVEIPYGEPGEVRPGEAWRIDCSGVVPPEGVRIECAAEGIVLNVAEYDTDWGTRPLRVPMSSGGVRATVDYRIALAPPPAPEITVDRWDIPVAVGRQSLIPLASLGVTCELCTAEGGAAIEVGEPEDAPDVSVGVGPTHLAVRSERAGDVAVPVRVTDDAGQEAVAELVISFVDSVATGPEALHVVSTAEQWDLAAFVWNSEQPVFACPAPAPPGLSCDADGSATLGGDRPSQVVFRVVDADGREALGSVTPGDVDVPVVPVWEATAPFTLAFEPPDDAAADDATVLSIIARLREGIS